MHKKFTFILPGLFLIALIAPSLWLISGLAHSAGWFEEQPGTEHLAMYYDKLPNRMVQCRLCPNRCMLAPGQFGTCKARKNIGGDLYSMVYGKIASAHVDPIEKKPFFHVLPGSKAFSIATTGCNMHCLFCQNWELSQAFPHEVPSIPMTPAQVVEEAARSGSRSIAFTYNEPVINYEFMLETARIARSRGIKSIVISAGYINPEPLAELLRTVDAYKVDFKAFREEFYQKLTGGHLADVLETMQLIHKSGVWLEVLNLLVPGENDSEAEIRELSRWIRENLGPDVPLHFSRHFPQYKLRNLPPTPIETVLRARAIAREEGLRYVYTGNVAFPEGEATLCPGSGQKVIERIAHAVISNNLKNGECADGEKIPGIWN
ncbi:MAG: AmmeMemoRadiSam system radical SAM enzyme [Candidatus Omnitrophota bacterium]